MEDSFNPRLLIEETQTHVRVIWRGILIGNFHKEMMSLLDMPLHAQLALWMLHETPITMLSDLLRTLQERSDQSENGDRGPVKKWI